METDVHAVGRNDQFQPLQTPIARRSFGGLGSFLSLLSLRFSFLSFCTGGTQLFGRSVGFGLLALALFDFLLAACFNTRRHVLCLFFTGSRFSLGLRLNSGRC